MSSRPLGHTFDPGVVKQKAVQHGAGNSFFLDGSHVFGVGGLLEFRWRYELPSLPRSTLCSWTLSGRWKAFGRQSRADTPSATIASCNAGAVFRNWFHRLWCRSSSFSIRQSRGHRDASSHPGHGSRAGLRFHRFYGLQLIWHLLKNRQLGRKPSLSFSLVSMTTASPRSKFPETETTPAGSRLLPLPSALTAPSSIVRTPLGVSAPAIQRFRAVDGVAVAWNQVQRFPPSIAARL